MTRAPWLVLGAGLMAAGAALAGWPAAAAADADVPGREVSILEERPAPGRATTIDPALRARFEAEYRAAAPEGSRAVLETYLPTLGIAGILDILEQRFPTCHDRAHELGKVAYRVRREMAPVLAACQTRCGSGCMHGVLMQAFTEEPGSLRARVGTLCGTAVFRKDYTRGDCAHGVGHGVAYVTGYDVDQAVALCAALGERVYQYYCASGAYMQLFMASEKTLLSLPGHFPCDGAPSFAAACYRYKVFYLKARLARQGRGLVALVTECLALPGSIQPACFHGIGHAHVGWVSQDPGRIRDACRHGPDAAQWLCIQGVVEKLAEMDQPLAFRVCEELSGRNLEVCREAARNGLYGVTKSGLDHYFAGR